MNKCVFILAIGFLPNIGGLETHLKDLIEELIKRKWQVVVLTYQPLHTPVLGKWAEFSENLTIYRLPSFRGLFYKLLKMPFLEFLFLEPLLFLTTPLILLKYGQISVVNAQGIIAGFSAAFWTKIFRKRFVIAAQSVYNFPKKGLYRKIYSWIFRSADKVIAISKQTAEGIQDLGVRSDKIQIYTNWENSNIFVQVDKKKAKEEIGLDKKFVVSFFGRLVEEKGIRVLLDAIKLSDKNITFAIYGEGPLLNLVLEEAQRNINIIYMKTITPDKLPLHYSGADVIIMPSLHEEGFGRVASGALLCSTPVIASNRGALPEVVNDNVGKIVNPIPEEIAKSVNFFFHNKNALKKRSLKARSYAINKFSSENANSIISTF